VSSFHEVIVDEVRRRGRVTFAEFMNWALYHPAHGYYTAGAGRLGRGGDFFTSVHAGGLFGRLLAEAIVEMWEHLGSGHLTLIELGASDGALADQILRSLGEKGLGRKVSLHVIEKSQAARDAARSRLARYPKIHLWEDLASFEHAAGVDGVVYSNEFFDALPVHRVRWEGGRLRELFVTSAEGKLAEEAGDPSTPRLTRYFEGQGVSLIEGQEAEVCLALDDVVPEIDRLLARGFVLTVDYGEPAPDLYRPERPRGTLRTFRKHAVADNFFQDIGGQDITAHVDFTRLAQLGARGELTPVSFCSQGTYLLNSGEALLKKVVEEESKTDPAAPRRVQQLLHPETMGGAFHVLVQAKNAGTTSLSGSKVNRLHRLGKFS
jgi:SAM-dependent MidA family methyltransferase